MKNIIKRLGPGLIAGASDDDPSGIGTYTQAGAAFGFATLWTAIITLPLMIVVQHICAKIGMCAGTGLAGVLREHYPRWLLYPVVLGLFAANSINIGTDIAAMAAAINLFVPIPVTVLSIPIAVALAALMILGSYRLIVRVFKWLALSLFAYVAAAFLARPDWSAVAYSTFVPHITLSAEFMTTIVAILGTTISPYLFFWEADQEVEDEKSIGRKSEAERQGATDLELKNEKIDTVTGMVFCNVVFYFVILSAGATLHVNGHTHIESAAEAALALRPLAGELATVLFAVGLLGAGLLAIPVLSGSAAFAVSEAMGWRSGLDEKPASAKKFYAVIAISTIAGIGINFAGIEPITALFWTAVINGLVAPPLLVVVMLVSNDRRVMGDRVNGRWANLIGWLAAAIMFAAAAGMFLS
ncbi:MAG: divalent metal cation transporter [Acidobacteriota bacterium]